MSKKHKKRKSAHARIESAQEKSHIPAPERTRFMIPSWAIALAWFVAAVPAASLWYYWDKSKFGILWSIFGSVTLVILAITFHIHNDLTEKEAAAHRAVYFGLLEPSNERPVDDRFPQNAVSLMLGNDLQIITVSSSQRVLQARGAPFLTIGSEEGKIWISTTVADSTNQTVVRVIKNEFQAFPEHAFNPTQPDSHSLLVKDSAGVEVLRLRFLNPRRILLHGRFTLPNATLVIIDDDGFHSPGFSIGHLTLAMMGQSNAGVINLREPTSNGF